MDRTYGKRAKQTVCECSGASLPAGATEAEETFQTVRVGSVEVFVRTPTAAEMQKSIEESRVAAARLVSILAELPKRLRLKHDKNTPIYYADEKRPHLVVRKLGKSKQTGLFKNGRFVRVP